MQRANYMVHTLALSLACALACSQSPAPADGSGGDVSGGDAAADIAVDVMPDTGPFVLTAASLQEITTRACIFENGCPTNGSRTEVTICSVFSAVVIFEFGAGGLNISNDEFQRVLTCVRNATSCDQFARCQGGTYDATYCTAAAHTGAKTCDGSNVVDCSNTISGIPRVTNCAASGSTCGVAHGSASCTDGMMCASSSTADRCTGTHLLKCDSTTLLEQSIDCTTAVTNGTCVSDTSSSGCANSMAPACTGTSGLRCEGDTLIGCLNAHELRADCTVVNSHCARDPNGPDAGPPTFTCVPNATACTNSTAATCSGTHLQSCYFGAIHDQDCTLLGFRTCQSVTTDAGTPISGCSL